MLNNNIAALNRPCMAYIRKNKNIRETPTNYKKNAQSLENLRETSIYPSAYSRKNLPSALTRCMAITRSGRESIDSTLFESIKKQPCCVLFLFRASILNFYVLSWKKIKINPKKF